MTLLPGWAGRTEVQRVRLYTVGSLYLIYWFLIPIMALSAAVKVSDVVALALVTLAVGAAGTFTLRKAVELYPDRAPVPWRELTTLVALSVAADGLVFLLPEKARFSATLVVVVTLAWGAGGLRDRRIQWALYPVSAALVLVPTGSLAFAVFGLGVALFLVFTVQSSLWLLGVVTELDRARGTQSALAVAEERLRFSRDVHDVLGRRLSTIAVQAELAATLTERGDPRAPEQMLQVRQTAHEALREARELARGYRPLDLGTEVNGAVSLLRSAGVSASADLADLPEAWHEPVARVIREAVTNVLRHSSATRVEMRYADGAVVIRNDGLTTSERPRLDSGSGLSGLAEHLAPLGAVLTAEPDGDDFVVRAELDPGTAPAGEDR
jgi:two-component system sensor histidine kinase DesK